MSSNDVLSESNLLGKFNITHLKFFGIWNAINTYRTERKINKQFPWILWLTVLTISPYLLCQIFCIFFVRLNIQTMMFVFINGVPTIQLIAKALVFWFTFPEQSKMFDLVKGDFLSCIPKHKQEWAKKLYINTTKKFNIYCFSVFTMRTVSIIAWIMFPRIDAGNGRRKIIGGWYPFPYWETPWFEMIFIYEACLLSWHGTMLLLFECILVQLIVGLYSHFKILGYHIATLTKRDMKRNDSTPGDYDDDLADLFIQKELEDIKHDYDKLHSYGALLKDVYSFLVTILLGTGIAVCVVTNLYLILANQDTASTINFVLFFCYAGAEITIICFCSSIVETASTAIRFAFYCSDWYEAGKKYKTAMQMIMIRSLKPLGLVALKMYPVNMEIVIGIFQFVYSTGTLLSKMNED